MVIGSLVTNIVADLSKWGPNLNKGRSQLASFVRSVNVFRASVGVAVASAGALWLKQTADQAAALKDQAANLNLTVEGMQRLRFASTQMGGNWNSLSRSVGMYNKIVGDATRGNKAAINTLRSLGLEARQLASMGTQNGILAAADAIRALPQSERASAARALFGRSGADNLGFLSNGSAAIQGQMNGLTRLEVISASTANKLDELADKAERLTNAWATLKIRAAATTVDIGTELSKGPNAWPFNLFGPRAAPAPGIPVNFPARPSMGGGGLPAIFPHNPAIAGGSFPMTANPYVAWAQQRMASQGMGRLNNMISGLPGWAQMGIGRLRGQSLGPFAGLFRGIGGMAANLGGLPGAMAKGLGGFGAVGQRTNPLEALVGGSREAYVASRENMRPRIKTNEVLEKQLTVQKAAAAGIAKIAEAVAGGVQLVGGAIGN